MTTVGPILLVHDDADVRRVIAEELRRAGHTDIVEAVDGEQGLRAALELVPRVVISDVHMPGMDGFTLLRLLQGEQATGAVPVILVSASFRDPAAARLAGDLGAAAYLEIPFDLGRLAAAVAEACAADGRRGVAPSARLLIVEDDADLAAIVRRTVERRGYLAHWVPDAVDLEAAIDAFRPDLLILDNNMPGRTGLAALTQMRVAGRDLAAIVLTAHADLANTVQFVRAGAEDVLSKPFEPATLLAAVGRALERRALALRARQFRERLDAERRSAARCASLVALSRDVIWRLDADGRLAELNPASSELLGTLPERLLGRVAAELVAKPSRPTFARAVHAGTGEQVEVDLVLGERRVPIEMRAHTLRDPDGARIGHWLVGYDLRRQRRLSNELAVAEKRAGIVRLIEGLSHEFSGALGSIVGRASLTLRAALDDDARDALRDIQAAGVRASELLCALRALAWTERPHEDVDPEGLTRLACDTRASWFARDGVALHVQVAAPLPRVRGRAADLQRAIEEVLDNARHACTAWPGSAEVTLTARQHGDRLEWEIRDTGEGVPAKDLPHVFDPFFTRKGALGGRVFDGKVHGTGLGLAIVQAIVDAHGGSVAITSEDGRGTAVRLCIPLGGPAPASAVDTSAEATAGRS